MFTQTADMARTQPNEKREPTTTLKGPISVDRGNFLEVMLILIMTINVGHIIFSTHAKFLLEN